MSNTPVWHLILVIGVSAAAGFIGSLSSWSRGPALGLAAVTCFWIGQWSANRIRRLNDERSIRSRF